MYTLAFTTPPLLRGPQVHLLLLLLFLLLLLLLRVLLVLLLLLLLLLLLSTFVPVSALSPYFMYLFFIGLS